MNTNHRLSPGQLLRVAIVCIVLGVLMLSRVTHCQEPSKDTPLKLALAHYVAMSTADAIQTTKCVQANRCTEQNPALAPMVNKPVTFLAVRAGVTSAAVVGLWKVRHTHPVLAKWLAVSVAASQTAIVISNAHQMRAR